MKSRLTELLVAIRFILTYHHLLWIQGNSSVQLLLRIPQSVDMEKLLRLRSARMEKVPHEGDAVVSKRKPMPQSTDVQNGSGAVSLHSGILLRPFPSADWQETLFGIAISHKT